MDEVAEVREQEHEDMANLSEGFKMTELGPLPEDWRVVAFSEAVLNERFGVGKVRQQEYQKAGRFPIVDQGQKLIAGYWDRLEDVYQGPLPVIIFGDHTRVFKFVDFPFVCGADGTKILVPDISKFFPAFLYFALTRLEIPNRGYNRHFSLLREQRLPCPPLPEQRAIAHVLRTVQRAKEATERVIQATQELKKSLMYYLFTYGSVPIEEAEKVPLKETEIGLVPEHWEVVRLGEVCLKPQYGFTESATNQRVGPKFLRITDIQNSQVNWNTVPYCEISDELLKRYRLEPGDLLFARIGATTGKTLLIRECPEAIFASYLIRVRVNLNFLLPEFLFYFTQGNLYWSQINTAKGGRLKQGINIPVLSSLLVPLPPISEQRIIARILEAVDKKLQVEEARKQVLDALFNSLLHNLMTAKIRVKDLNLYNIDIIQRR